MSTNTSPAIDIRGLSKTYSKRGKPPVHAVRALDLRVPGGQVIGLLGANGAGKTTTIKMMCGLIVPTTGEVALNGYPVRRNRGDAMRQIGAVLEGTRNVYWRLSAQQNLHYFGRLKGIHGQRLRGTAEGLLRDLDLWARRDDPVRDFSRGMQQKVAIACALVADPPIVLLDEPTLGLDVQAARTVRDWVLRLARERGKTVVLTTHQLSLAQQVCDRIVIMRSGALIADHPIGELLNLFRGDYYQVRVGGAVDGEILYRLESLMPELTVAEENGHTLLTTAINEQAALYAMLDIVQQTGMPLLGVQRIEPDLEEVFVKLMEQPGADADSPINTREEAYP